MSAQISRRKLLALMAAAGLPLAAGALADEDVIDLEWSDLIPREGDGVESLAETLGVISHDQISSLPVQQDAVGTTHAYDGKRVRIPGFVVPLEYLADGVTSFILVPFVGACIHVPPPPANQLVLVTSEEPHAFSGLFEPVLVTGMFGTAATSTELADIGYALSAERIDPYEG